MPESEEWVPTFPGQRAPFAPGHELSTQHGAYSPRRVDPLAAEIEQQARALPSWPPYLSDPIYARAVSAWAHAEAQVELLNAYLSGMDLGEALSTTSEQQSDTEQLGEGHTRTRTKGRRVTSALDALDRAEARAARARQRIGMDPLSRARLGKDYATAKTQVDLAQYLADLREQREATTTPEIQP